MTARTGQAVTADGVTIWWSHEGTGPTVVLVPGRGDSSDVYPPDFSDVLVVAGCSVLRFDPRDTGLSGAGGDAYTLATMADDIVAVVDDAGVREVHVVGLSMGGMVTVDLAVRHAHRIASIVFLSAMSPDPEAGMGPRFFDGLGLDAVTGTLASMGAPTSDDEAWMRRRYAVALTRAPARPDAATCHQRAGARLGWPVPDDLATIAAPTIVVHGEVDLVLPLAHADALAAGIPGARRHVVEGMGHLPTAREWRVLAELASAHALVAA